VVVGIGVSFDRQSAARPTLRRAGNEKNSHTGLRRVTHESWRMACGDPPAGGGGGVNCVPWLWSALDRVDTGLFAVARECGLSVMGVHAALRAALVRVVRAAFVAEAAGGSFNVCDAGVRGFGSGVGDAGDEQTSMAAHQRHKVFHSRSAPAMSAS